LIGDPDCIVIIDPIMAKSPALLEGLSGDGMVIANSHEDLQYNREDLKVTGLVDATGIALEELGRAASNTCMLGAIAKTTGWVGLDAVVSSLDMHFSGDVLKKNVNAVRRGYEEVRGHPLGG
jgi:2-oxoacid:acceptor oxidoreductase gamma subunit (pyruvate/2-ketoisovalerate family)